MEIAAITSVNVGQLSRLENGQMKRNGQNLQKVMIELQKLEASGEHAKTPGLVERFTAIIHRSARHAEVATAFVDALDRLM